MRTWRAKAILAVLLLLMASWLLSACPVGDGRDDHLKDRPRRERNY